MRIAARWADADAAYAAVADEPTTLKVEKSRLATKVSDLEHVVVRFAEKVVAADESRDHYKMLYELQQQVTRELTRQLEEAQRTARCAEEYQEQARLATEERDVHREQVLRLLAGLEVLVCSDDSKALADAVDEAREKSENCMLLWADAQRRRRDALSRSARRRQQRKEKPRRPKK